jgi:pimeloyl-ACP methyl ester carboxylesterase
MRVLAAVASLLLLVVLAVAPVQAAKPKPLAAPAGLAFYTPPKTLPGKTHGDLIWSRRATGKNKLKGANTSLVLYRSVGVRGKPVAVSGLVSIPRGKAPKGGFPVVSWAHGTTAIADQAAPTLLDGAATDYIRKPLLEAWVRKRYAVVQTDYEGLGTPGVHPYLIGRSEGRSVLDIVRAAHRLDPRVGRKLAIAGHSQGGHAALFATALAPSWTPELKLRATVAFAPASRLEEQIPAIRYFNSTGSPLTLFVVLIAAGLDAGYPSLHVKSFLTPKAAALLPQVDEERPDQLLEPDSFGGIPLSELFRPDADISPVVRALAKNDPSNLRIRTPVRVEQGTADQVVFSAFTDRMVDALKAHKVPLTYNKLTGKDHVSIVAATASDARRFIAKRLSG